MTRRIAGLTSMLLVTPLLACAQVAGDATDIPWADIQAVLNSPVGGADRQVKVVDIGSTNVAVGILHRDAIPANEGATRGIVHTLVTEVYYIVSGSGTLVTGGPISDRGETILDGPLHDILVGPSFTGYSGGSTVRIVSEGDVVVIPAGVFHGWSQVPDHVTYLSIRPDPEKVLPAGYTNPATQ